MKMNLSAHKNILERIVTISKAIAAPEPSIAFLGYTELALSDAEWRDLTVDSSGLTNRPNSDELIKRHGRPDVTRIPTISSALQAILERPFQLTIFDFIQHESSELQRDFNLPIEDELHQSYDLVLDLGTCEHIFSCRFVRTNALSVA